MLYSRHQYVAKVGKLLCDNEGIDNDGRGESGWKDEARCNVLLRLLLEENVGNNGADLSKKNIFRACISVYSSPLIDGELA